MSNLNTYSFHDQPIRTTVIDQTNEIVFCLADVCKVLTLQNPAHAVAQIKEEFGCPTLNVGHIIDKLGRDQSVTFITEPQLYFVMMRSRAKVAREFRQWICNEVLPAIRKTGKYVAQHQDKPQAKAPANKSPWFEREIRELLVGYVSEDKISDVLDTVLRAWKQGYAIACDKAEKVHAQGNEAKEEGSIILDKCDAERLRNMLHYMPYVLNLLRDTSAILNLLKSSKLLVPSYDLHFALEYETKCLKEAVGE